MVEDDPAAEDDFEVDLEAVDAVSFALAVVSLGCFEELEFESIPGATASGAVLIGRVTMEIYFFCFLDKRGYMTCPESS